MVQLPSRQHAWNSGDKSRKCIMEVPLSSETDLPDDSALRCAADMRQVSITASLRARGSPADAGRLETVDEDKEVSETQDPSDLLPQSVSPVETPRGFELSRPRRMSIASTSSCETALPTSEYEYMTKSESLINNEIARALGRSQSTMRRNSCRRSSFSENEDKWEARFANLEGGTVDWQQRSHQRRMRDLCTFIRRLFNSVRVEVAVQDLMRSSIILGGRCPWMRIKAGELVQRREFSAFFVLLIIYAIFGPDFLSIFGYTPQDNVFLASFNTVVFLFFFFELCLNCWVVDSYGLSLRFWVDLFATITMLGDTWIMHELVDSDVAAAGRGSRLMRMMRMGRSSRIMRLVRMTRFVQVLRLVPRLQNSMVGSSQKLAMLLLQKRLWHIFQYLSGPGNSVLGEEEREYFFVSLTLEFADRDDTKEFAPVAKLQRTQTSLGRVISVLRKSKSIVMRSASNIGMDNSFQNVLGDAMSRREEWKNALNECEEDVQSMRSSCEAVDQVISSVMLKICIAVIFCIIMTSLLVEDSVDQTPLQDLMLMSSMKEHPLINLETFCSFVNSFESRHKILLFLVVNLTVFWDSPGFSPCRSQNISASSIYNSLDPIGAVRGRIESSRTLQPSQFASWCYPDGECENHVHSIALYDVKSQQRSSAANSLLYTCVAVTLLTVFVLGFSVEISTLSNGNLMHPLWEILDDICSMKCIEVIAESSENKRPDYMAPRTTVTSFTKYSKCEFCAREEIPTAEELVKLSGAIAHLKRAMRSWVKFVPPILFQNIVKAGIEATIGVCRVDVTVLFCDIKDFKDMIQDVKPNVVLDLMGKVLSRITDTVEDYEGQMLEFVGDEILAVFNAPAAVTNHGRKAVCSAVLAQERMNEIRDFDVRLHIGINRASVLAGNLGSLTRMKYGVLGDGVNMAARIKSLNTRFSTCILASPSVLDFENSHQEFVTRPIGNLVLKGRTVPTLTYEVLGLRRSTSDDVIEAAKLHSEAFDLYLQRCFVEAKMLFNRASEILNNAGDRPALHLAKLCEENLRKPPTEAWDGSEYLTKKAW